jgi:hypothetical protein
VWPHVDGCELVWPHVDGCELVWPHVDGCELVWAHVDAPEDVMELSSAAIHVMPSDSLRAALSCATEMLRSQKNNDEVAAQRHEKEAQRLQQEVTALASSLKVLFYHSVCSLVCTANTWRLVVVVMAGSMCGRCGRVW